MSKPHTTTETRSLLQGTAPTATGRRISGYAALFNSLSENMGTTDAPWHEVLAPGCFPDLKSQDVRALVGHDTNRILARSKKGQGTMRLSIDSKGLSFDFEAPRTQVADDLLESIRRKDLDGCSFSFIVAAGGDSWKKGPSGAMIRTIHKIEKLLEISMVTFPAYPETSVSARSRKSTTHISPRDEVLFSHSL